MLNIHTDIGCETESREKIHEKKIQNLITEDLNTSIEIVEFKPIIQEQTKETEECIDNILQTNSECSEPVISVLIGDSTSDTFASLNNVEDLFIENNVCKKLKPAASFSENINNEYGNINDNIQPINEIDYADQNEIDGVDGEERAGPMDYCYNEVIDGEREEIVIISSDEEMYNEEDTNVGDVDYEVYDVGDNSEFNDASGSGAGTICIFSCEICGQVFEKSESYHYHKVKICSTRENGTLKCPFKDCTNETNYFEPSQYRTYLASVINHIRAKHTKEALFKCKKCPKKYFSRSSLYTHSQKHNDIGQKVLG